MAKQLTNESAGLESLGRSLRWYTCLIRQGFPICPDSDDPDSCNVYKNLDFPEKMYDHISEYQSTKMGSAEKRS